MGQLLVLLLLFDEFGLEVLGGDPLDIFPLLLDFNTPHRLSLIIFHVPLLLQVELIQKLLTLEACLNLFYVFRVLSGATGGHNELFALLCLCLLLDFLLPSLLS